MSNRKNNPRNDDRGLVLSGLALLLILPAVLLASTYFTVVFKGGETTSIQATSDKVFYAGTDIENLIAQMNRYDISINNTTLNVIEKKYELAMALEAELHRTDNLVTINIWDPNETAKFSSSVNLSENN